jgi:tetratricopeptide (TPR) repeat protein
MFTKEIAFTLPIMILLYELFFLKAKNSFNWKGLAPFLLTLLIIPFTIMITRSLSPVGVLRDLAKSELISPYHYFLTQLRVMLTYIRLLFIPLNQNLDYDYPIAKSIFQAPVILSALFLIFVLLAALRLFKKYRLASFGIFWFFITLLPESSIIPIKDVIFEHRLYLPMFGFSLFLSSGAYYLFREKRIKLMALTLFLLVICYSVLAYQRNKIWKDDLTLWNDVVHKSPKKARPYISRGVAYHDQGNSPQAISDCTKAIEINPNYAEAYNNRGNAYTEQGNLPQAILDLTKAIEINPNLAQAYNNRGVAYYEAKEYDKAWQDVHKAEELGYAVKPGFIKKLKEASGRDK